MKQAFALLLIALLIATLPTTQVAQTPQGSMLVLRNKDIWDMHKAGLTAELILAKIRSSRCSFDTFPPVLAELKQHGLPDVVLLAMVEAPVGVIRQPKPAEVEPVKTIPIPVPDGTEFIVSTTSEITSSNVNEGDPLTFRVDENLVVDGHVVVARGSMVKGTVTNAEKKGMLGKGGKLGIRIDSARAVDGQKMRLRAAKSKAGGGNTGTVIALTILVSPLFLLMRGNTARIKEGTKLTVYTDEALTVQLPIKTVE